MSAELRPNSAKGERTEAKLANWAQVMPNCGLKLPNSGHMWPPLAETWSVWFGRSWPNSGQKWPHFAENGRRMSSSRSNWVWPILANTGERVLAAVEHRLVKWLAKTGQFRPNLAKS